MQEAVPRVIGNHSKLSLEESQGVSGGLGSIRGSRNAEDKDETWGHFGATWSILCAILAPTGFRRADPLGVCRCIWLSHKNEINDLFFDNCTAKIGGSKTMKNIDKTKVQSIRRFSMF